MNWYSTIFLPWIKQSTHSKVFEVQGEEESFCLFKSCCGEHLHESASCTSFESSSLCLLPPFLLRSITEVAEQTHGTIVASLGIKERAWFAVTTVMSSGANARKLCWSRCWLIGSWNCWNCRRRIRRSVAWLHIVRLYIWPLEIHILRMARMGHICDIWSGKLS